MSCDEVQKIRDWSDVVGEAVRRHVDSTGDPVFSRQELIDAAAEAYRILGLIFWIVAFASAGASGAFNY